MTYKFYGEEEKDMELEIIPSYEKSEIIISMLRMGCPEYTTTLNTEEVNKLIKALKEILKEFT